MAFKYYLRGPDNWTELSNRMHHWMARCDADALSRGLGPWTAIAFQMPNVRHGLERPAKYEVRCTWQNTMYIRFIRFEDGERAEVKYAETAPDVHADDHYYPAPPAV